MDQQKYALGDRCVVRKGAAKAAPLAFTQPVLDTADQRRITSAPLNRLVAVATNTAK